MSGARNKIIGLALLASSAYLIHRLRKENPSEKSVETHAPSKALPLSTMLGVWFNIHPQRSHGITPTVLLASAKEDMQNNNHIRSRIALRTMLRFTPQNGEAKLYEESGNLLAQKGYVHISCEHWECAFNNGHRPYAMSERLGQIYLVRGQLDNAFTIFNYLHASYPASAVVLNELGVTWFMHAASRAKYSVEFFESRGHALRNFQGAINLEQKNPVLDENRLAATVLTPLPYYGSPHRFLAPVAGKPTRMLPALYESLQQQRMERKKGDASSYSWTKGDYTTTTYHYEIQRPANEAALVDLSKIMQRK